jgi:hypothetical protein
MLGGQAVYALVLLGYRRKLLVGDFAQMAVLELGFCGGQLLYTIQLVRGTWALSTQKMQAAQAGRGMS